MQRGLIVLVLALVATCKGKSEDGSGAAAADTAQRVPAPRPLDLAAASPTLACVIEAHGRDAIFVPAVLADFAPVPLVRMAARLAIERARLDGPASLDEALRYEAEVLWGIDDVDGLRELFALTDADPQRGSRIAFTQGPQRVRAGIPLTDDAIARDRVAIARELALAGNRGRALQVLERVTDADLQNHAARIAHIGALAATGQGDRARRLIESDDGGYRAQFAGAWVETALRAGGPIAEPLATLVAEIRRGTDGDVWRLDVGAVLRRARTAHRQRELAPMIEALRPRLGALLHNRYGTDDAYALAIATGDVAAIVAAGGATAELAQRVEVASAPLDRAFATARRTSDSSALLHVWARWLEAGAEPALGAQLSAALCPAANRTPATPATGVLSAAQVDRPKRSECAPHDVVLRLTVDDAVRTTVTLEGSCTGACTPAQKRAGAAEKTRIEREIAEGTTDPAAANYRFTGCAFVGFELDEVQTDNGREIAILREHYQEAHDIDVTRLRVAFEVCGDIYVSDPFRVNTSEPWQVPRLRVAVERDVLVVRALADHGADVVLRLALPACPGVPTIVK